MPCHNADLYHTFLAPSCHDFSFTKCISRSILFPPSYGQARPACTNRQEKRSKKVKLGLVIFPKITTTVTTTLERRRKGRSGEANKYSPLVSPMANKLHPAVTVSVTATNKSLAETRSSHCQSLRPMKCLLPRCVDRPRLPLFARPQPPTGRNLSRP